ncbi:uncharacterized protein LOC110412690 isoform X2 [Herrania umbratica]|uniref:Uncharacterized protein LOC110412690 isoform X2 n=1 Tax=Herrania umbratica TaxID=108875 RepID=A0A6J0ZX50_9ROSI|nr:uncharacterized protein LOC110412690 isoform X2 [Herrania umbratica]
MEHSPEHSQHAPGPSSALTLTNLPSSSSSSSSSSRVHEEGENNGQRNDENLHHQEQEHEQQRSGVSYHLNISISNVARIHIRDDVWSCLVVLVTFWFFASMTLILGYYGSVTLELGPNGSRLIQTNPFFVQSIKVKELIKQKPGLMLYGFHGPPPSDVEISWTETHDAFVPANLHKEWLFFLNKGSKVNISYAMSSTSSSPLSLVIAQGTQSLVDWIEDPSYPNLTLSWNIIYGRGKIQQEIPKSSNYYIAVRNLNSEEVEIQLNFSFNALIYDTTQAHCRCSLGNRLCTFELYLLGENAAVLSSPGPNEETSNSNWYVKVSYGPRWITYFVGSGVMTILILLAFRICKIFQSIDGIGFHAGGMQSERAPLLPEKDDEISSWGSSYDSVSHDEEDLEEWLAKTFPEGKPSNEGDSNNTRCLCVVCFEAPRDCFFLPCGHCATCFTCGTRIAEDAGSCPICRRKMKKVRMIFTV